MGSYLVQLVPMERIIARSVKGSPNLYIRIVSPISSPIIPITPYHSASYPTFNMLTILALLVPLVAAAPAPQGLLGNLEVGKLPALGWNSWNAYKVDINEEKFLSAAQKLVDLGLKVGVNPKYYKP